MLFKKIKLENIRSHENAEIEFSEGSVLLSGDIGSGKTSILLAIEFALFGLQPGQKGSSLLKNGKSTGSIILEFEVDGKTYVVERVLKKGSKTISQDSVMLTDAEGTKEMSVTELKNFVLTLLNYPLEFAKRTNLLYRFTVYTPQEEMKQIILEDAETRLNTLRHIFGIDRYKRIKENSSILLTKLREEVRSKEGQIYDLDIKKENLEKKKKTLQEIEDKLITINDELEKAKKEREKTENEIKDIENKINKQREFEKEIEKTSIMLINKRENIINLDKSISEIKLQFEQAISRFNEKEFNGISKLLEELQINYEKSNKEFIEVSSKIKSIEMRKFHITNLKNSIKEIKTCPTCMQNVSDTHKKNIFEQIDSEIKNIEKELSELFAGKKEVDNNIKKTNLEIKNSENKKYELNIIRAKIESLNERYNKISEMEKQKKSFEKDIELLEKHSESLKESVIELKKFENIYKLKEKELNENLQKEKQIEINKAEINHEIKLSEKEILNFEQEIKEKENIKKKLDSIKEVEDWLSSEFLSLISFTERNVLATLRAEFTKLFNEWFSVLVPENFIVRLDEDFTPIIEQQDYQLDYAFLSGGERTAVALAYRLALNQTINSLLSRLKTKDIVILDEPTDGFSEQQLDKMRDVLQQLNVKQLILVSHEQKIESFVDKIIRFKKENGITKVER